MATQDERRLYVRARVPATATTWIRGSCKGSYIVENLSLGGALLSGGPAVCPETRLQLHLQLPDDRVEVTGIVLRSDRQVRDFAIAVAFDALAPAARLAIGAAVAAALETAVREMRERPVPTVVVIDHSLLVRERLARDIRRAGSEAVCFSTSGDAIDFLRHPDCRVQLALIDRGVVDLAGRGDGAALVDFLTRQRPEIRRVLMLERGAPPAIAAAAAIGGAADDTLPARAEGVLAKPWDAETLARTLLPQAAASPPA